jgi:hypothetical protein
MSALAAALRQLVGMFVDDGALALSILAVVALAGVFAALAPSAPLLAGGVLAFGCLGVLLANALAATRR